MEFWGVEVKPGQVLKVDPGEDKVIHLSQAALGESKKDKGNDSVFVHVNVDDQKLVLGSLSSGSIPQIQYDVVFDQDFELSHTWKHGSVYFCGYKAQNPGEDGDAYYGDTSEDEEADEELAIENGKPEVKAIEPKAPTAKPAKGKTEPKAAVVAPKADETDSDEDDSEEEDSDDNEMGPDEDDDSEDEEMMTSDEEEEETPTPKKPEAGKKRAASEAVTPAASTKKAKATPQKTDGKKASAHVATPHPAKQAGKTPASKAQTPKSAGSSVSCGTCSKTFNSEQALSSHSKAKHGAK